MRRFVLPLAVAACVGAFAPAASAESCYGVEGGYVCFEGSGPSIGESQVGACVYTGGTSCTPYYVPVPSVSPGGVRPTRVCLDYCYTREDISYALQVIACRVRPEYC